MRTDVLLDSDGTLANDATVIPIFDGLAEADAFAERFDPERRARRDTWAGGVLLGAFTIWSIIAAFSSDEHFLWFYIGMKLLVLFFLGRRSTD